MHLVCFFTNVRTKIKYNVPWVFLFLLHARFTETDSKIINFITKVK